MNTYTEFQPKDLAGLDLQLLASALQALQELVSAADGDYFTDAPECQVAVNRVQDAIQAGYQALIRIRQALEPPKLQEPVEVLACRILDEAEEAFAARSLAERRAREGRFPMPVSIQDYLFWIEDELRLQGNFQKKEPEAQAQQQIYVLALFELTRELRWLGFKPSSAPWQVMAEARSVSP